ncbi:MAG: HD domain-containing protein [Ruminococcaceae bacterium]|nr:HD domain-containing protein [Oscillospiraceae bacterium]
MNKIDAAGALRIPEGIILSRINAALAFLKEKFDQSVYFTNDHVNKKYRFEHSIRVANIAKTIALAEGFDVEALTIAALLHDVSYCEVFPNGKDDVINHGRFSARIARPFIEGLGFDRSVSDEMLYAIAIHVDGKADFEGESTHFVQSVSDADNIDRFGVYRLHEGLVFRDFLAQPLGKQIELCRTNIDQMAKYEKMKFATLTATKMWLDNVRAQRGFYTRLLAQLENSLSVSD